ncbi:MAG: TRAP-type transporter, periplasmic solute binding receptor (TAXI family protein), partial [Candidatus Magnetoglobus multicellularis str. Araruama]
MLLPEASFCDENTYLTIGSGDITGLYYLTGGAISHVVNSRSKETGLRLNVQSTPGSIYNIDNVISGAIELGIVQSDRLYQAVNSTQKWPNNANQKLRAVFGIHAEAVTVIASEMSGITNMDQLKGKRVNLGHSDSGQRQNAIHALENQGIDYNNDLKAEDYVDYKVPELIHSNQLDAAFITGGHPTDFFNAICSGQTRVRFISIMNVGPILKKYPYYIETSIPVSLYSSQRNYTDVKTFGVKSILMTSEHVSERAVYIITKEVFSKIKQFKKLHPVYVNLSPRNMIEGLTAPIHSGAL